MVGGVPVGLALRDLFYAAGLGFLLCVGYSAARMLLGSGKAVCFICDAAVLAVGALLYRSAAMSRFYAGQPRWYTLAGCVLCFLASLVWPLQEDGYVQSSKPVDDSVK